MKVGQKDLVYVTVTTPEPPEREWVHSANPERTQLMAIFSVMSYNVLCDKYATRQVKSIVLQFFILCSNSDP